ncbi:hypothetical protein RR46_03217 [Papilio xuthus]|uniref:Ig-like domain-containing protein n=1 Tax=Papilio xuthus TaxID=66420 RepID=A0A194QMA6_PAPXU|nr:hypothetical protein RR46_03217 [Papilio xuthus]
MVEYDVVTPNLGYAPSPSVGTNKVATEGIHINITSVWKPDFGWEVTCMWETPPNDTLQSVRLQNNGQQFMIYRPEAMPPSSAELEYKKYDEVSPGRVMMNCTSSGLPAPNLQWTVANDKVQADFTGRFWNRTTKLWHVWSFFAYTRADPSTTVTCSPEVLTHEELLKGTPATFSSASIIDSASTLIVMFTIINFLR